MNPQTQKAFQSLLDGAITAGGIVRASKLALTEAGTPPMITEWTPTLVVPPAPAVKRIIQDKSKWAHEIRTTVPTAIQNEVISDGGFCLIHSTAPVLLSNVCNEKGNNAPQGSYFLLAWPDKDAHGNQQAVSKIVLDNSNCTGAIYQGAAEAAIRLKCDDFHMIGPCTIFAHLNGGNQVKPVLEIRHGKNFLIEDVTFQDGYPEIGAQTTKQPDGSSKLDTSQHVGTVTFSRCKFTRWADQGAGTVVSKKKGCDKIVCVDCVGPDGKTFSRTW